MADVHRIPICLYADLCIDASLFAAALASSSIARGEGVEYLD